MKIKKNLSIALVTLSLMGCETQPEDIAKWKAEGNTSKLIGALDDSRQFIRIDAISALEELHAEKAVVPLGALLKDPDVVIVHKSINALAAIGTPSIEPYMLEAIAFKTDPARLTAAKSLGALKSEKAIDPLINTLNDPFDNIAVAAAVSLGQIGNPRAIPALSNTAHQGSVRLRSASTTAIRTIGGPAATQAMAAKMGDLSLKVRNQIVAGMIDAGDASESIALEKLKSENDYERLSALQVLEGIHKVPTTGENAVWFQLANLSTGENPEIQREQACELAEIPDAQPALIAAVAHPSQAMREHAFLALEEIGEPAAQPLVAAAASAKPEAAKWFNERSGWAGAPAWQLDLWGAATALNPSFGIDKRAEKLLTEKGKATADFLASKQFQPDRELIPQLINRMATTQSSDKKLIDDSDKIQKLAFRKLRAYKQRSKFPLLAALNDDDLEIAAYAAEILVGFNDDPRTALAVIESFSKRVEAGENLAGTPFQDAMLELNTPETDALLLKIRPNAAQAIRTIEKKYPGIQVFNIPLPAPDKLIPAEPFRLKYLVDGRAKELKVIFRPNENGDWVPNPPLPDELP